MTRKPLIAWLALLALVLGQTAAGLHALKHYGSGDDAPVGPAQHVQVCLDCATFAPLAGAHGGPAHTLLVLPLLAATGLLPLLDVAYATLRYAFPFQARAPPR